MTIQSLLDERYGRSRRRGRRAVAWTALGTVSVAVVGALAWSTVSNAAASVDSDVLAFSVVDRHSVQVSFQITGNADREVACVIEALDADFGIVGWKVVVYPPRQEQTRAHEVSVPTVGLATTGLVNSCWLP
ncbi:MAG TPA: DUF4307 domain-containing protein [Microbacterium sp.]|nr:DUF4307 domain-containing protein [Microbacterium sp.]